MIRGFILGKFMPPHAGHLFACQVARQRVDELTVLVCSHDAEPIPGTLRAQWMRDSLPYPGIHIIHMHRDIPQVPEDHPDFWNIWKAATVLSSPSSTRRNIAVPIVSRRLGRPQKCLSGCLAAIWKQRMQSPISLRKLTPAPHLPPQPD